MRPKTVFLMAVAIGAGLVAAFLASFYHPGDTRTTLVLVAASDLQIGTPIEPEKHLQHRPFLPDSVPQGAVANIEDLRGKVLGRNIPQNTPVTVRDLNLNGELLALVPKGTRAVTVRVTLENAQAGFTLPGAHVDLVCTLNDLRDGRRTLTKTFMQHVLVLAVNTHSQATTTDKGVISNPATVTLAVKPQEAQRIIWAKERGSITMTLRKPDDKEIVATEETYDPFGELDIKPKAVETVRIMIARKEIPPGTMVDDVSEYFESINFPAAMVRDAIVEQEKDSLRGQTVRHLVPEGFPVTAAHLRLGRPDKPGQTVTWLGIQISTQPPRYYKFVDGRSANQPDDGPVNLRPDLDRPAPPTPKRDE